MGDTTEATAPPQWTAAGSETLDTWTARRQQAWLMKWTAADSEALDEWILAQRRARLQPRFPKSKVPDNCRRCGAAMRKNGTKKDDHPGTIVHKGRGHCSNCYEIAQMYGEFENL